MHVRVYEVTKSTILDHATGKHVIMALPEARNPQSIPAPDGGDAQVALECAKEWGDILALCATPKHVAALNDDGSAKLSRLPSMAVGSVVCEDEVGDLSSGTSILNALLATLGVPLVVRRTVRTAGPVVGKKAAISHIGLSVEQSSELCEQLFGADSGAGTSRRWGAEGVTDWQLQVVYVSDTPQSANEDVIGGSKLSISAPFVRYIFRDHMQQVFPTEHPQAATEQ